MAGKSGLTSAELAAIRAPIAKARTLPPRAFHTDEFFALERDRIFHRHWAALCFAHAVPNAGDARPLAFMGIPLVVVRGDDGRARVFHNICPYDGSLAVRKEVRAGRALETYYHGWRYDLRGKLIAAPWWDGTPEGSLAALAGRPVDLIEVRAEERLGIVFVDLGGRAGDIDAHLAPLRRILSAFDLDGLSPVEDDEGPTARTGRMLKTNWKTYLENAAINILHEAFTHESYRKSPDVPRAKDGKPTFFTDLDGPLIAFGFDMATVGTTYGVERTPHLGRATAPTQGFFITYYPNLVMPVRPTMMRMNICLPEAPGWTRILHCGFFPPRAVAHADFKAFHENLVRGYRQVYAEDQVAVEAVQATRRSPAAAAQYYAPFWDALYHRLNRLIADDVAKPARRARKARKRA